MSRQFETGERDFADQFDAVERIGEHGVVGNARDPQRLSVGGDTDAVRGCAGAPTVALELGRRFRQNDARSLLALREIDHRESVQIRELHEDPSGGAVGSGLDCHRTDALVERELPGNLVGREIDDGQDAGADRAGDDIFAVRRHVDVVQAPVDGNALDPCQRRGIDDVERAGTAGDADDDAAAVLRHCDIVGVVAERHLLDQLAALAVECVEGRVGLVADIDPGAVGREGDAVRSLDPFDRLHRLVGGGVDGMDAVARAVGDIDAHRVGAD